MRISRGVDDYLKESGVSRVWRVDDNAHDPMEWRNNLCLSVQNVFR